MSTEDPKVGDIIESDAHHPLFANCLSCGEDLIFQWELARVEAVRDISILTVPHSGHLHCPGCAWDGPHTEKVPGYPVTP